MKKVTDLGMFQDSDEDFTPDGLDIVGDLLNCRFHTEGVKRVRDEWWAHVFCQSKGKNTSSFY